MRAPKVSIGLPVHNGENYLADAVTSILGQTFGDFELVISDNASTDGTAELVRSFATRDARVRYSRNETNIGAAANYRKVFHAAAGRYFKWAAHDDVCHPDFLTRCIDVLDSTPDAVVAFPRVAAIGPTGAFVRDHDPVQGLDDPDPVRRFARALAIGDETFVIWGLMRRDVLAQTTLLGSHVGHDRTLLSQLSLRGRLVEVPDVLLSQREHPDRSVHRYDWRRPREALAWYDSAVRPQRVSPTWRLAAEHARGILCADLTFAERARCAHEVLRWSGVHEVELWTDVVVRSRTVPVLGWLLDRLDPVGGTVNRIVPEHGRFVLVDDDTMQVEVFGRRRAVRYIERDGMSWGPPENDAQAIAELERHRDCGAHAIVFCAQTWWYLDHYRELRRHLDARYPLAASNRWYRIYDLRRPATMG
jgi:hypothetical protein